MAEVEDVRATGQRVKAPPGRVSQGLAAGEQGERVEIALDRKVVGQLAVGPGRIDGLVEPDRYRLRAGPCGSTGTAAELACRVRVPDGAGASVAIGTL